VKRRDFVQAALVCVLFAGASFARAEEPKSAESLKKGARMLFVTQSGGFKHGSVNRKDGAPLAPAERAMTELGVSSGLFRVDCTQDVAKDFTKENLQNYDIVMFYTTGPKKNLPIPDDVLDYFFQDWLRQKGHGFMGAHSAADTYGDYEPYWDMIGGTFDGHPWGSGETVTVTVHDKNHPVSKPWGDEFTIKDEIYRFRHWQPEKVHVLMSLNMAKTAKKADYHVPIAWVKDYGQGKVMHMSLGHNEAVWANPTYMESMLGGVKWILGYEKGDATPNPELSAAQEAKAKADYDEAKPTGAQDAARKPKP
jgi:type 1 glutamine amidotransferase